MLISRLDIKKYRWANPKRWVTYRYPTQSGIDPVFEGRLAALGAELGLVIVIVRGAVTTAEQTAIADLKLRQNPTWVKRPNGAVYNTKGQCMVAAPGSSPHEQHLAIDGDKRIEAMNNYTLARFGLIRPMAYEPWHIQPMETKGMTFAYREKFRPYSLAMTVAEFQEKNNIPVDNIYGPQVHSLATKLIK